MKATRALRCCSWRGSRRCCPKWSNEAYRSKSGTCVTAGGSSVCRRIPGIEPIMSVKARIAAIRTLQPGETVGYGMRFTAPSARRIAVLPIGYGDGFPRVRNQGFVLVRGQRALVVGGVAMDSLTVDITDIPAAQLW